MVWWFITKKGAKKSFNKVKDHIKKNKEDINSNKLKIAQLEGMIKVLLINSQPKPQPISQSPKKSQKVSSNIETKLINRVRRGKKALIMAEISKLKDNHSVIEMYDVIVLEKGFCSKATYYRYIQSLKKSQKLIETIRN